MAQPKKPTGEIGMMRLSAGEGDASAEFMPIPFPTTKPDIEEYIVKRFLAQASGTQVFPYCGCAVEQNPEADLDFTLTCADKKTRKLELMELAPLEHLRGAYAEAPNSYNSYDFAKYIVGKIFAKSQKYGRPSGSELHLLVYITDWRFLVSDNTIALVDWWLAHEPHNFTGIYLYEPIDQNTGLGILLYPSSHKSKDFDPEAFRGNVVWNADPKGWKPVRGNGHES